jgi:hypothetical protein
MYNILNFILNNKLLILVCVGLFSLVLNFKQCSDNINNKEKLEAVKQIYDNNIKALSDSTIVLKLTREQLKDVDKNLSSAADKIDSIKKIKAKEIYITRPIDRTIPKPVKNNLTYDSAKNKYSLTFQLEDSVKYIEGTSSFVINNKDTLTINPDSTIINKFKFNFALVITKYDDNLIKATKIDITPFYLDSSGNITDPISEKQLELQFRGVEFLQYDWYKTQSVGSQNKKRWLTGWALTISPLAIGLYSNGNGLSYGITPNIGISYFITYRRK